MNNKDYTYRTEAGDEGEKYFVSFTAGNGQQVVQETDVDVFTAMKDSDKAISSQVRSDKRHLDKTELEKTDPAKTTRVSLAVSVEDSVITGMKNASLKRAIELSLTKTERRRVVKYFWERMTAEEIAAEEGCSHQAVTKSIRKALSVYPAPKTAAARGLNRTLAARGTAPPPPI